MIFPKNGQLQIDPGGEQNSSENIDPQTWLNAFRTGTGRPSWMATLQPDLEKADGG